MKLGMQPVYTHDCPKCKYLGSMFIGNRTADWYQCKGFDPSVIARFSSDGPDYWSTSPEMVTDDRYLIARRQEDNFIGYTHMKILARFMLEKGESK